MDATKVVIGVDVSATELVCAPRPAGRQPGVRARYANSARGVAALVRAARGFDGAHVVCEATGNHHVRLQDALWEARVPLSVLQPRLLTHFAALTGARNKTDALDAALLARYGVERDPPPTVPPSPERRRIQQLTAARRGMVEARTRLTNQIGALKRLPAPDPTCLREFGAVLRAVERSIARVEAERAAVVEAEYGAEAALLRTIKGIGPQTAAALLAYGGDLSSFGSPRALVAFVGTNPSQRSSGTSLRVDGGISKQGNRHLRTLLYMGAQSARKHNAACRALYERLVGRGKTKKQALIAVASKLARQAWAVLHHRTPYVNGFGLAS